MYHKVRVGAANNVRPHYVTAGASSGMAPRPPSVLPPAAACDEATHRQMRYINASIHRSAWKGSSANYFAFTFSEVRMLGPAPIGTHDAGAAPYSSSLTYSPQATRLPESSAS